MTLIEAVISFAQYAQTKAEDEELKEFYRMLEEALIIQRERENPQPLTLEELRQMIGEPIFIKRKYEAVGHWKILDSYGKCSTTEETFDFSDGEFEVLKHYGKVWLAYLYPPKEATHAAENDS